MPCLGRQSVVVREMGVLRSLPVAGPGREAEWSCDSSQHNS